MTRSLTRTVAVSVVAIILLTLMAVSASFASAAGRRNTALLLAAGAIYAATRSQKTAAYGLGAGSLYGFKRHSDARRSPSYCRGCDDRGRNTYRDGRHYQPTYGHRAPVGRCR